MKINIEPNKIIIILDKETKFSELESVVNGLKVGFPDREVYINGKVEWNITSPKQPITSPLLPRKEEPNPFVEQPYPKRDTFWYEVMPHKDLKPYCTSDTLEGYFRDNGIEFTKVNL